VWVVNMPVNHVQILLEKSEITKCFDKLKL